MKRIVFGILVVLFIGIFILRCNIPMTASSVVGTYANTNYQNVPCCVETPHRPDRLILKSDGSFSSDFFGNGTYKINYRIANTEIELHYKSEFGNAAYFTYFSNKVYENPKIILNYDLNHYYEKID